MIDDLDNPPEMALAFDEGGHPISVTHPFYETQDDTQDEQRSVFQEKLAILFSWMAAGKTVEGAGRRALLLAHMAGKSGYKTDKLLARRLNITSSRISQLRAEIIDDFGDFGKCNSRQNATLPHYRI